MPMAGSSSHSKKSDNFGSMVWLYARLTVRWATDRLSLASRMLLMATVLKALAT